MKKLIDFKEKKLVDRIQKYANENYNGNFNEAVRALSDLSLETINKLSAK